MKKLQLLVLRAQDMLDVLNREEGQDLIEYALLVGLISLAAVAVIGPIGNDLTNIYTQIATQLKIAVI